MQWLGWGAALYTNRMRYPPPGMLSRILRAPCLKSSPHCSAFQLKLFQEQPSFFVFISPTAAQSLGLKRLAAPSAL